MTVPIAIPSYRRAETLAAKTMPMLTDSGIDLDLVTIFVCDDERDVYAATFPDVRLERAEPTMRAVRNIIARHYPVDEWVVSIDDDITAIVEATDPKTLVPVDRLDLLLDNHCDEATVWGARLWGLYAATNPMFMYGRPEIDMGLWYIGGGLFGCRHDGTDADLVFLHEKDDYERSCRRYLADGLVCRFSHHSWRTTGYQGAGGMQEYRTPELILAGAEGIVELFPDIATLNLTKKSGKPEIRLRDRRR